MKEKNKIKNIWIYGVGGVGGYFGGKMAYKIAQNKNKTYSIFFIARGPHLVEIKKNSLILNTSEKSGMICKPSVATDNTNKLPVPDLCLICVKSYDLNDVIKNLAENIRNDTIMIPLLNGVDIYERIRSILNKGIILPACVYVSSHLEKSGVVTQRGREGIILCGNDPKFPTFNPQNIIDFFNHMGIQFSWNDDPYPTIWEKYIFIASFGLVTAFLGMTIGEVISNQESKELIQKVMKEIISIARKQDVKLHGDIVLNLIEKAKIFPFETKTSYQRDREIKGKRNEGDLFGGTIIRIGQNLGVPTPITQSIYLKIQEKN